MNAQLPSDGSSIQPDTLFEDWVQSHLHAGVSDDTVIVFIPSHDRNNKPIKGQDQYAAEALALLGRLYRGATAFQGLKGVWRDDDEGGNLVYDSPIMVQALARRSDMEDRGKLEELGAFLRNMGKKLKQGAVGVVLNDAIHFISKYD